MADEIPATLQRLVEFLIEQMPRVEVLAVEIRQYRAAGSRSGALVSRVVGQTSRAQAVKERPMSPAHHSVRWTADQVLESIVGAGQDAAAVASRVRDWAEQHPDVHMVGGTGVSYPSITLSADSGRARSRWRGVLSLYGAPVGESPMLEIRVKRMCRTPPYNRAETRAQLVTDLKSLGIPASISKTPWQRNGPNIPLGELSDGRTERLL